MYHFTLAKRKTANAEPKYNGDIIWDESDGPRHLKFWTGEKYERLSDMVYKEIARYTEDEGVCAIYKNTKPDTHNHPLYGGDSLL